MKMRKWGEWDKWESEKVGTYRIFTFSHFRIFSFPYSHIPTLHYYFFFASAGFTGVVLMRSTIFFVTSGFAFR